jgi:hypothetical protein
MAIDSNFINKLPDNVLLAEQKIVDTFYKTMEVYSMAEDKVAIYEDFIELYSFYQVYAEKHVLDVAFPRLGTNSQNNLELIISFFRNRHRIVSMKVQKYASERIIDEKKTKFKAILFGDYLYEFTSEELKTLRMLLYQLKNLLTDCPHLDSQFTQRLTRRIDNISKDLHIEMPSLDILWGLVGEAGVIVGKAGEKVAMIVNKIREVIHLIWQVQARSEKLSSDDTPMMFLSYKEPEKPKERVKVRDY